MSSAADPRDRLREEQQERRDELGDVVADHLDAGATARGSRWKNQLSGFGIGWVSWW